MTTKNPDDLRGKGNIEAVSSVIANWLEGEQARTRLVRHGAAQMSIAELLAQCFASGLPGENAVLLSQRMQKEFGSVHALLAGPIKSVLAVRNVGPTKAARLEAINELSVRETENQLKRKQCFNKPVAVARFPSKRLGHLG